MEDAYSFKKEPKCMDPGIAGLIKARQHWPEAPPPFARRRRLLRDWEKEDNLLVLDALDQSLHPRTVELKSMKWDNQHTFWIFEMPSKCRYILGAKGHGYRLWIGLPEAASHNPMANETDCWTRFYVAYGLTTGENATDLPSVEDDGRSPEGNARSTKSSKLQRVLIHSSS